jgi:hypothetical protein
MTKKIYNQPQVLVAQLASMPVMQAASPAPADSMGLNLGIGTTTQW